MREPKEDGDHSSDFTELIRLTHLLSLNLKDIQKMLPKRWDQHGSN